MAKGPKLQKERLVAVSAKRRSLQQHMQNHRKNKCALNWWKVAKTLLTILLADIEETNFEFEESTWEEETRVNYLGREWSLDSKKESSCLEKDCECD